MFTVLMFIILLSMVVVFHEFGHFIVGKMFRIGVEAFAVGFGKAIVKTRKGETEYRINWIPFGGYVKFVGESPEEELAEEDKGRAFNLRPPYQKALVVFAGPFMNVVLAFLIFAVMFLVGFPTTTSRIGYVSPGSPAAEAGLLPGDRIVSIDGHKIWRWDELSKLIEERPNKPTEFTVERGDETLHKTITPQLKDKRNVFGFYEKMGTLGVAETGLRPLVGIPYPDSPAAEAGLKTGDLLLEIDGKPIDFQQMLPRMLKPDRPHTLVAVNNFEEPEDKWNKRTIKLPALTTDNNNEEPQPSGLAAYGIEFTDLYIHSVEDDSPAQAAGVQTHDKILSVDGKQVTDWGEFTDIIRDNPDKTMAMTVLRDGKPVDLTITPELYRRTDIYAEAEQDSKPFGRIGVMRLAVSQPPEIKPERYWNPFKILGRSLQLSAHWTVLTVKAFGYIFTGDVSPKAVGGPITIAVMAGESARLGVFPFFMLMAIISLNLAVINLVPMPVLDGGHLLFYSIEAIRRKPLSPRAMEYAGRAGFAFLGLLILFILYVDVSRFSQNIKEIFMKAVDF